jgi:hypothetical protein
VTIFIQPYSTAFNNPDRLMSEGFEYSNKAEYRLSFWGKWLMTENPGVGGSIV